MTNIKSNLFVVGLLLAFSSRSVAQEQADASQFRRNDDYNRRTIANGEFFKADRTRDWKLTKEDGESWAKYQHLDRDANDLVDFEEFAVGIELPLPDFGGKTLRNVVYKEADGRVLLMDIHQPADDGDGASPVLYYSHGGGWSGGQKEAGGDTLEVCKRLSDKGYVVVMVSYRLVREWDKNDPVTMRDCIVDCRDGLRFLKQHETKLDIDMDRVAVFGSSAGGHLAQLMTFSKPESFPGDTDLKPYRVEPAVGVSWFGPSDFRDESLFEWNGPGAKFAVDFWSRKITRGQSFKYEQESAVIQAITDSLSPVWWLSEQSRPLLHIHGDQDSVVPPQHGTHLLEAAKQVGAPVEVQMVQGAGHGWWAQSIKPSREQIIQRTVDFIVSATGK